MLRLEVVAATAALVLLERVQDHSQAARRIFLGFTTLVIAAFFMRNAFVLIGLAALALLGFTDL